MKGELFYGALLYLYPKPFRTRFGAEMIRLFHDCYPDSRAFGFWLDSLKDFLVSAPREWRREICRPDSAIDYTGLADAIMGSIVVGTLLLGWGVAGASFAINIGIISGKSIFWGPAAGVLFTALTLAFGAMVGVLSTWAATRSGRNDKTCSQFIISGKITARFSQ
jgi:hypothetical protein